MRRISVLLCFLALAYLGYVKNIYTACDEGYKTLSKKVHYSHPWKVHEIAKDFALLDVWEFPIRADKTQNQDFSLFLKVVQQPSKGSVLNYFSIKNLIARFLVLLRVVLGETFGLDKNVNSLPIPGCQETSLKDRLSDEDLARSLAESIGEEDQRKFIWRTVYFYKNEIFLKKDIPREMGRSFNTLLVYSYLYYKRPL